MTNSTDRKKVANIYLDPLTHETIKKLAAHQTTSMQTVIATWLDETQPVMAEMVKAIEDIKNGKDMTNVLTNLMGEGLRMAGDQLIDKKEYKNVTDNRQSD